MLLASVLGKRPATTAVNEPVKNKDICEAFFKVNPENPNSYICNLCGTAISVPKRTNYINRINHLKGKHKDIAWEEIEDTNSKAKQSKSIQRNNDSKITKTYEWLSLIAKCHFPISLVGDKFFRKAVKFAPISKKTFCTRLFQVSDYMKEEIKSKLKQCGPIGIIFDRWTHKAIHYVGVYAVFQSNFVNLGNEEEKNGNSQRRIILLSISYLDEDHEIVDFTAKAQVEYLKLVLGWYDLNLNNNIAFLLCGDNNCNGNESISKQTNIPLIGCFAHRLSLAVQAIYQEHYMEEVIDTVNQLMKTLSNLKTRYKLQKVTNLCPKTRDVTRWTSVYHMLKRFQELAGFLDFREFPEVAQFFPSQEQIVIIDNLMIDLKDIIIATKVLQGEEDINPYTAQAVFDSLILKYGAAYPSFQKYLSRNNAEIASSQQNEDLRNGIIKIISRRELDLTEGEKLLMERFKQPKTIPSEESNNINTSKPMMDFVSQVIFDAKQRTLNTKSEFIDLNWIPATSCLIERLFSISKRVVADHQNSMSPHTFEALMMLSQNAHMWNIDTVKEVFAKKRDEESTAEQDDETGDEYDPNDDQYDDL